MPATAATSSSTESANTSRGGDVESDDAERYAEGVTDAITVAPTEGEPEDLKSRLDGDLCPLFEDVAVDQGNV
ncbi:MULTISPECIES: hypothetical protein [Natrialbaceae]|uniref:hypothetical protein n=1 Tax=Natrialbaceae TaxID=1644061 RepID=UPI00207C49F2|nr:hypothetical protein [Natronococcus sp. CG52]